MENQASRKVFIRLIININICNMVKLLTQHVKHVIASFETEGALMPKCLMFMHNDAHDHVLATF
jgi:hypothetical protein